MVVMVTTVTVVVSVVTGVITSIDRLSLSKLDVAIAAHQSCLILLPELSFISLGVVLIVVLCVTRIMSMFSFGRRLAG